MGSASISILGQLDLGKNFAVKRVARLVAFQKIGHGLRDRLHIRLFQRVEHGVLKHPLPRLFLDVFLVVLDDDGSRDPSLSEPLDLRVPSYLIVDGLPYPRNGLPGKKDFNLLSRAVERLNLNLHNTSDMKKGL